MTYSKKKGTIGKEVMTVKQLQFAHSAYMHRRLISHKFNPLTLARQRPPANPIKLARARDDYSDDDSEFETSFHSTYRDALSSFFVSCGSEC